MHCSCTYLRLHLFGDAPDRRESDRVERPVLCVLSASVNPTVGSDWVSAVGLTQGIGYTTRPAPPEGVYSFEGGGGISRRAKRFAPA